MMRAIAATTTNGCGCGCSGRRRLATASQSIGGVNRGRQSGACIDPVVQRAMRGNSSACRINSGGCLTSCLRRRHGEDKISL
jgi:hypothetical protein